VNAFELADKIDQPDFVQLIRCFLYEQLGHCNVESTSDSSDSLPPRCQLPFFDSSISVYTSALATFYAPSDLCGIGGMCHERIRAISSWRGDPARYDCVLVKTDPTTQGMLGLDVACVRLFFSFAFHGKFYLCALVHWFSCTGNGPDDDTGMWIVRPELHPDGSCKAAVLHIDTIVHAAHLIGVYGKDFLPKHLSPAQSLDIFQAYYVNKYIDHHSFEITF